MARETLVLVGTAKGLFRLRSVDRIRWDLEGPDFPQTPCYAAVADERSGILYAAVNSEFYGPSIRRSRDFGATWDSGGEGLHYAADDPEQVRRVWSIAPGPPKEPGLLYAGVEDSGLFITRDGGDTWAEVANLRRHPTHELWAPGYGGKCLHTISLGPGRDEIAIACSAGGFYRSADGGESWAPSNTGLSARFLPEGQQYPLAGQCVHKVMRSASHPGRMWLQNHGGVYRSDDGGETWNDVSNGLPGDFSFPIVADPHDADRAYVIPLQADGRRWAQDAALRVFSTDNAGGSWRPLGEGLPPRSYASVLRDAFHHDGQDPLGLYFGTTSGSLFVSSDAGGSWREAAEHLPRILSVRAVGIDA